MKPETRLKTQNITITIGVSMVFGLLYNYFFYPHTLTEFLEAGSIGIIMGLLIGVLEEFVFKNAFHKISTLSVTIIRVLLYTLLISFILCLVLSIEVAYTEQIAYSKAAVQYLSSKLFQRDFLFSISFIIIVLFVLEIIQFIGRANFFRLFLGMYRQPREVSRIFMFLDIKSATTIAERLSNKNYSAFIRDFFYDISDGILIHKGEIYQYAGDEIIISWPIKKKNSDCIRTFFKMKKIIERKSEYYLLKYGRVPEFKAGIHAGEVITTTVGKQKKEIAYHGDVLNTTARIEGKCNELGQQLLISENTLPHILLGSEFKLMEKGEIDLKGKSKKLSLYGVLMANGK